MPYKNINRRQFVQHSSTAIIAGLLAPQILAQTANPPMSDFNAESTAEEVTEGIDLTGKIAVVTGGNSGLGYETMRVLAKRGAHVICTSRTMEKAETACASIEGKTLVFPGQMPCDLSSLRISFKAARLFRHDCTSTSRTSPSQSKARHRYTFLPLI